MAHGVAHWCILALLTAAVIGSVTWLRSANADQPKEISQQVAAVYGERHPRTLEVSRTVTDNSSDAMYVIVLAGRFVVNGHPAHYLRFSALADRHYVWAIFGYMDLNGARKGLADWIWADNELPTAKQGRSAKQTA